MIKTRIILLALVVSAACASGVAQPAANECADAKAQLARAQSRLNDWPALARYRDANSKLPAPAQREQRVVFMGDSITDSWDDSQYGGFFPGKPYVNRGISGQTTPQMLARFRADVIALRPKVVVILAGTNDLSGNTGPSSLEMIQDNLTSMVELARANRIQVVLASVLPVSDHDLRDGKPIIRTQARPPEKIKALNEWMKNYAAAHKLVYLDYHSAMIDAQGFLKDEFSEDGLHPNLKGYAVMAPLVEAAIAKTLKSGK